MRIGIDTRDLALAATGTRTYLEEIIAAFQRISPRHEVILLYPVGIVPAKKRSKFAKIWEHATFSYWKHIQLPRSAQQQRCDIIFCTDYTVPLFTRIPAIPVFHDATFWRDPAYYNRIWRLLLDLLTVPAAKRSPAVVTVSEFARKDIAAYTGIAYDRIVTIPNAPKAKAVQSITQDDIDAAMSHYGIDRSIPVVLHVGVMVKRKNLVRLVEAFALFHQQIGTPYQLVLVGVASAVPTMDDSVNIQNAVERLGLQDLVKFPGHVPDAELSAFYQNASMFIFPSKYEGFGIPILEAFHNNLPVAAANSSAIPEVVGDAALLFDPDDPQDIANAMLELANDYNLRMQLISKGQTRRDDFSWDKTAQQLIALFENVLSVSRQKS